MPWPPKQPPREQIEERSLPAYDMVIDRAQRMFDDASEDAGYYGRLLLTPDLGNQISEIGRMVRMLGDLPGTYSHAQREFVDQVLSADFKTNIVQHIHLNDGLATGVRVEAIEALRSGNEEALTSEERQLASFIRQVVQGRVRKDSWETIEAQMGARGTLEYAIFILFLQFTMRLMSAVGMPEMSDAEIDATIADFKNGSWQPADFRRRIA